MSKTAIVCITTSRDHADRIVAELKAAHFFNEDISVLFTDRDENRKFAFDHNTKAPEGVAIGAGTGGVIGGILGMVAGMGALAIPGVGPFLAAGPIAAALSGLAVGVAGAGGAVVGATVGRVAAAEVKPHAAPADSIAGGLISLGVSEAEARRYEARVDQGDILVAVHAEHPGDIDRAREILIRTGALDIGFWPWTPVPANGDTPDLATSPVVVPTEPPSQTDETVG